MNASKLVYTLLTSVLLTFVIFYFLSLNQNGLLSGANTVTKSNLVDLDEAKYKEDYIYVDLSNMNLSTYKNGEKIKSYEIVSKGKPGSYYETPVGNYEVVGKYGDKFSKLGEVYMPSAIQFLGNYFIHGIPYHRDGTKVSSTYSGGCIRLKDNDAKEVYEFAQKGIKVIVTNSSPKQLVRSDQDLGEEISTRLFYILISLDVSNQEQLVSHNGEYIKALDLIALAINGDEGAYNKILNNIYELDLHRENKIKAIGISESSFTNLGDRIVLYNYIKTSKSYLLDYL